MTVKTAPIELIHKVASALAFEELTSPHQEAPLSTENLIFFEKIKCAEDLELLKIATDLCLATNSPDVLETYEDLGGKYKHAFGTPMFAAQQMAGSPAVAGGMARRATTSMPQPQQAQAVKSPATSTPRSQAQGMISIPSAAPQTATPAPAPTPTPAAPTTTVSVG